MRIMTTGALALPTLLAAGAAAAEDVTLGSLAAVTGPIPELVAPMVKAQQLAIADVNAQGGILGGGSLELVIADSQCDAKAAVDAATKLVNVEQVQAIVGAVCSGGTIGAVQAVTIPAGVVSVSPSATSPALTELEDDDLVFRTAASDSYLGVALAERALELGYDETAVMTANDDYNVALAEVFVESFTGAGGTVTAEQMHEPNKPSYRSELAALAAGGADTLAVFAYYDGSGTTVLRQSLENGYFTKFIGADGMVDQSLIEQIGADYLRGNSVFMTSAADTDSEAYKTFAEAYSAAYADEGHDPAGPYVANSYDAAFLLALAIEHAGGTERANLSTSLRAVASAPGEPILPGEWAKAVELIAAGEEIDYQGAGGDQDFDENGDVKGHYTRRVVSEEGAFVTEPAD
jgi:branched-chain amino acid transport system substrate-binding protein